jgi:hypothetical protein
VVAVLNPKFGGGSPGNVNRALVSVQVLRAA